jgi:hypothetical protein
MVLKKMHMFILGLIAISACYFIYSQFFKTSDLKCIISNRDNKVYCVRNRNKMQESVNLLAEVTSKMQKMVHYMEKRHPHDERVVRLVKGFNPNAISETLPTSKLTAFSENKGEKIAMCLNKNKRKGEDELIDMDTLTFVALHELSHIMTLSIGHEQEFWENFKFLLQNADESNIYRPKDYRKQPTLYCGMTLNDNPYFDL